MFRKKSQFLLIYQSAQLKLSSNSSQLEYRSAQLKFRILQLSSAQLKLKVTELMSITTLEN
jgi:hypothetical protein